MSRPLLDPEELLRLRQAAQLSRRALGRAIGVSGNLVGRLEAGASDTDLTLHQLHRLAATLGTTPRALLHHTPTDDAAERSPDTAKAASALADSPSMLSAEELAHAFSWDIARAHRALLHLRRSLPGSGLALRRSPNGFKLIADADTLNPTERQRLQRARTRRHGLRLNEAALLRAIAAGTITTRWETRARNSDRVALAALLKAGYATYKEHRYALADDVAFSFASAAQDRVRDANHRHRQSASSIAEEPSLDLGA